MMDIKSIALVVVIGAAAGSAGAWMVLRLDSHASDAPSQAALASIEERLEWLETRSLVAPANAQSEVDQPIDMTPQQRAPVPEAVTQRRPVTGRPDMLQLMDESVDADIRRARAYELLDSPMAPARFMAIRALAELGDPGVLDAVQSFVDESSGDPRKQRMAAGAVDLLGDVQSSAVDAQLYEYLNHESHQVQISAARQLEVRGDGYPMAGIVEEIAADLADSDSGVRSRTAQALGRTRSPNAVAPLATALDDKSSEVRLRAAQGLGMTGGETAVAALTNALEDPVAEVRSTAAHSLDRIRNPGLDSSSSISIRDPFRRP